MERLTDKVHQILRSRLKPGDVAIDATAGNGHDTLFLAKSVGPAGWVYAFDVQPEAILQTQKRLESAGCENVRVLLRDHAEMADAVPLEHHGQIAAVTFNLGYLPGSDKTLRTEPESTCRAIAAALALLREGGVLSVLAYTGHAGGLAEADAVGTLLKTLPAEEFAVEQIHTSRPDSPRLFVVIRQGKTAG
jgi:predicted methyltransferase